jgi:hypothetical protein
MEIAEEMQNGPGSEMEHEIESELRGDTRLPPVQDIPAASIQQQAAVPTSGSTAELLLDKHGWMDADGWGKEETDDTNLSMGEFVRLHAPLVEATAAAMLGTLEVATERQATGVAAAMDKVACTVPSMMALSPGQQDETLAVLVEWAALVATKRAYPLEVIGRGLGGAQAPLPLRPGGRRVYMRVRVVCEIAGQHHEDLVLQREYGHTVHSLELLAANKWGVDARTVVSHGGCQGHDESERRLSKDMHLGHLRGAGQETVMMRLRKRVLDLNHASQWSW